MASTSRELSSDICVRPAEEPARTPGLAWPSGLFRAIDLMLRHCLGIRQFCSDPRCIIRIRLSTTRKAACLPDGTRIARGDGVGELHFWNEQLPQIPSSGPGFRWALVMRRQFEHSLRCLATHVESSGEFVEIAAFRGDITFAGDLRRKAKLVGVAKRHGFAVVEPARSPAAALHDLISGIFIVCLIRTFNPGGLRNGVSRRRRYEVWISKRTLIERHGGSARADGTRSPP